MGRFSLVNKYRKIISYAVYGFLFGLFFPIVGTAFELSKSGANLSFSTIQGVYLGQPLMMIINTAPIILSTSFALIGIQAARAHEASIQLNERIIEQEIQAQNEHYFLQALISSASFAVVRLDTNHHIVTCNEAFENLFGYTCEEIIGKHIDDMITPDEYHKEVSRMTDSISDGNLVRIISKRMRKDGNLVDVEIVGVPVIAAGEKIGVLGLYHDISLRRQVEQALKESEYRFKTLFNESPISLWEEDFSEVKIYLDQLGEKEDVLELLASDNDLVKHCMNLVKILDVNQATIDLYKAKTKSDLLVNLSSVLVDESLDEFRKELLALISGENTYECEIFQKKLNGDVIFGWLRFSVPPGSEDNWDRIYISIIDITDRKKTEEKLRFMSFHDALTGLFNRAYFEEELARLDGSRQYPVSIISCDLDGLKQINDQFGHDAGDRALRAAAKVLSLNTFRKEDVVARIGGDEFVVVLPSVDLDDHKSILDRINIGIEKFNKSTIGDGLYRPISMSIGYAVIMEDESLAEGYKAADKAMYINKEKKKAQ